MISNDKRGKVSIYSLDQRLFPLRVQYRRRHLRDILWRDLCVDDFQRRASLLRAILKEDSRETFDGLRRPGRRLRKRSPFLVRELVAAAQVDERDDLWLTDNFNFPSPVIGEVSVVLEGDVKAMAAKANLVVIGATVRPNQHFLGKADNRWEVVLLPCSEPLFMLNTATGDSLAAQRFMPRPRRFLALLRLNKLCQ